MGKVLASREGLLAAIIAALVLGVGARAPVFLTAASLNGVLSDPSFLFMLVLAQMGVILTRGIDLSVAANLALSGMVAALVSRAVPSLPIAYVILLASATWAMLGAVNGVLISLAAIPPIVVTLGTLAIFRGLIFLLAGGAWLTSKDMSPAFLDFPRASAWAYPA